MNNEVLQIVIKDSSKINRQQDNFNKKVKRIQDIKQQIDLVQSNMAYVQQQFYAVITPLLVKQAELQEKVIWKLDALCSDTIKKISEKDKKTLIAYMLYHLVELIESHEYTHLVALHDKYAAMSYKEMQQMIYKQEMANFRHISQLLGLEMQEEDFDLNDRAATQERIRQKIAHLREQTTTQHQHKKAQQKKSKTQVARENEQAIAEKQLQQTSRMIYTSLVKQLHPDTEQDETRKGWKNEMMKKVTIAYEKNDFYTLFQLQIELNIINSEHLNQLTEEQLKTYNTILDEQLRELELTQRTYKNRQRDGEEEFMKYMGNSQRHTDFEISKRQKELLHYQATQQEILANIDNKEFFKTFVKKLREELKTGAQAYAIENTSDFYL